MNLLPILENGKIIDGQYIQALPYCHKNCDKDKCKDFYKSIENKATGLYLCPNKLSVYLYSSEAKVFVFTSLREKKIQKKYKRNFEDSGINNPILPENQLQLLFNYVISQYGTEVELQKKKEEFDITSHEIKKINTQIGECSEIIIDLLKELETAVDKQEIIDKIQEKTLTINISSKMIKSRFDLVNYENNRNALKVGARRPTNIYGKFDKMTTILKNHLKKHIPLIIHGKSKATFKCYQSFELVPFMILENAVKYSARENEVSIDFNKLDQKTLEVSITSFSLFCTKDEIMHIFEKGYRGKNGEKISTDGSGIGLYFTKMICDANDIEITIDSNENQIIEIDDIPYAPFTVTLTFNGIYEK